MGYRSDIKYIIDFPSCEKRDTFINMVKIRGDVHEIKTLDLWDIEEGAKYILCSIEGWKWYDSFPEVQAQESLLEESCVTDDDDKPLWEGSYLFLRVGENWDDNEEKYGGEDVPWGTVCFNRTIDFDI